MTDAGDLLGAPLVISQSAGPYLVLVDASDLAIADGGLSVGVSEMAAIQMSDTPTPGAAQLVSAWQNDLVFLRVVRHVHWQLGHADGAAFTTLPIGGSPA
jgi:hypothetical protein